jgi:pimeloyl-ACP methyl ester carboxylesterase
MNRKIKSGLIFSLLTLIIITILIILLITHHNKKVLLGEYPADYLKRPAPDYKISLKQVNNSVEIYSLNFKSKDFLDYSGLIYGLLFIPKDKKNIPGIVMLPGGGVSKESFITRSIELANLGYAVLVIDQRGIGETGGPYPSLEEDYGIFASGKESIQHLSVYDPLAASDVLRNIKNIDKKNIAIIGESMGGRYAIIATALDERLKGVIAISSSGFHFKDDSQPYTPYLLSIDPDTYIGKIFPHPVLMLQGDNDSITSLEDAQYTFNLAKEPKRFFIAEGCGHGYCEKMSEEFKEDLKILFEEIKFE